jgi:predicted permease
MAYLFVLFYKIEMPSFINNFAKNFSGLIIALVLLALVMSLTKINITNFKIGLLLGIFKIIIVQSLDCW